MTMSNYLHGRLITVKKAHYEPVSMNSEVNKIKRQEYVETASALLREGKTFIYMDETNFNLFCRRTQARSKRGHRATVVTPNSRGRNLHIIGAITAYGVVCMTRRRGAFRSEDAKEWVNAMMQNLPGNLRTEDVVFVCDNAPAHSRLQQCEEENPGMQVLKLAPYSPMLNPVEGVWSKVKSFVKQRMGVPAVAGRGVLEQRMNYVERLADEAMDIINGQDCAKFTQHAQSFFADAAELKDMPVGR